MHNNKSVKLYNVMFPIWMLIAFPLAWIVVIPANFIIDSAVILIALKLLKQDNMKHHYKRCILKVFLVGFIGDIIGGIMMFAAVYLSSFGWGGNWLEEKVVEGVMMNPFMSAWSLIYTLLAMALASVIIYFLNMRFSFSKLHLDKSVKHKLALTMAIVTSPYLFLLPSTWIY